MLTLIHLSHSTPITLFLANSHLHTHARARTHTHTHTHTHIYIYIYNMLLFKKIFHYSLYLLDVILHQMGIRIIYVIRNRLQERLSVGRHANRSDIQVEISIKTKEKREKSEKRMKTKSKKYKEQKKI